MLRSVRVHPLQIHPSPVMLFGKNIEKNNAARFGMIFGTDTVEPFHVIESDLHMLLKDVAKPGCFTNHKTFK